MQITFQFYSPCFGLLFDYSEVYSEFIFEVLKVTDMKKTILTIAFSILAIYTYAQRAQLGVQASPLFSIASYDGESQNGIG